MNATVRRTSLAFMLAACLSLACAGVAQACPTASVHGSLEFSPAVTATFDGAVPCVEVGEANGRYSLRATEVQLWFTRWSGALGWLLDFLNLHVYATAPLAGSVVTSGDGYSGTLALPVTVAWEPLTFWSSHLHIGGCTIGSFDLQLQAAPPGAQPLEGELSNPKDEGTIAAASLAAPSLATPKVQGGAGCPDFLAWVLNLLLGLPSTSTRMTAHVDVDVGTPTNEDLGVGADSPNERITTYRKPEGTELEPAAAARVAAQYARSAGETGEAVVEVAHGTVAETSALLGNTPIPDEAHPEGREWLESTSYIASVHGTFTRAMPGAAVPRGRKLPEVNTIALIVDAHSGFVEGEAIGNGTLAFARLASPVVSAFLVNRDTGALAQIAGGATDLRAPLVRIEGRVYAHGRPVPEGWRVYLGSTNLLRHPTNSTATDAHGRFMFYAPARRVPVTYRIGARNERSGRLCGVKSVRITRPYETLHLSLRCRI